MISSVRAKTTVKPGGFVEVHSDELPEGATVEVIVLIEAPASNPKGLFRFTGAMKGQGSFDSVADIDEYIRQARDSWDS